MELRTAHGALTQNLWVVREGMASPVTARLSPTCRSTEDDLIDTSRDLFGAIYTVVMTRVVGCGVRLLNNSGYRSRTLIQQLEDVRGSTAKGCGDCCDGGSNVKNGVTPIKTRLLRKGQSSGSDTMLEILKDCIVFFE